VDAHAGYDFGILEKLCSLWGGAVHHDNHHKNPKCNFQPFFTWWDTYLGTDYPTIEAEKCRKAQARASKAKAK